MKKIMLIFTVLLIAFYGISISEEPADWGEMINVKIVGETDTAARVVIDTTKKIRFHVFKVSNPPRLVVEMVNAVHKWPKKEIEVNGTIIERIRSGQYKYDPIKIVRVVIDLALEEYYFEEISTNNQIIISLALTKEGIKNTREIEKRPVRPHIQPNIATQEHEEKIAEIFKNIEKREQERKRRIEKAAEKPINEMEKEKPAAGTLVASLSREIVDFNFIEADILEILRTFEMKLDKNIVPAKGVSGKVSLRLKQVPFDEAFEMLLDRLGLIAIQKTPHIIGVVSKDDMPTQRVIYHLKNRTASELKTTLEGLLGAEERVNTIISVDYASNSIIVTATAEVLNRVELLINQFDIKTPQVAVKVRFIEISEGYDIDYGVSWIGSVPFDGREWAPRFGKDAGDHPAEWDSDHRMDVVDGFTIFPTGGFLGVSAIMDQLDLHATLRFIEMNTQSKTISEPTIITESNKSAKIHVGKNIPIKTTRVTEVGTTEEVIFFPEGVDLTVTPVVSPGSRQISLKINVGISELVGFRADNPITTVRSAQTEVTVECGKTIVIGGLIREKETESDTGIPILKDIPLLGYLFKNQRTITERSELLIFLSSRILEK